MYNFIPENGASLWGDLSYDFDVSSTGFSNYNIIETRSEDIVGVKRFNSTWSNTFNVAPIVRSNAMPDPHILPTTIAAASWGYVKVEVQRDDEQQRTPERVFTLSHWDMDAPELLSTMPTERFITLGESDTLLFWAGDEQVQELNITYCKDDDRVCDLYTEAIEHDGLVMVSINTLSPEREYDTIEVKLSLESRTFNLQYTLLPSPAIGERIAWLSTSGSIEHYTFPVVKAQSIGRSGRRETILCARHESAQCNRSLSEIVCSPRVWRVDEKGYHRVSVLNDKMPFIEGGNLTVMELTIDEYV